MVIMTPNNIPLFIVLIDDISKHLVRPLVSIELGLEAPCRCKPIFLGKPKVMKERPQYVITVAIVILVHYFFIKKDRNASLLPMNIELKTYL